jgi:tetratricopeptide (TPR) repeat protein
MIEYLEKLVRLDRDYAKGVAYAEQLMRSHDNSPKDLLIINCALLLCRYTLHEYNGAVVAGQMAMKLAEELGEWDYYGIASLDLGACFMILAQYQDAIEILYRYLSKLPYYQHAAVQEPKVWFNLGRTYTALRQPSEASDALSKALQAAVRLEHHRYAHGIRHALIDVYTQAGNLREVPRLIAQSSHYLRHNPDAVDGHNSWQWHLKLRIDYVIATKRLKRAEALALRGLSDSDGEPRHQFVFHMQLACVTRSCGWFSQALGHFLAAQVYAANCQRRDLESEASQAAYELTRDHPGVDVQMNAYYLSRDLDSIPHG